MFGSVARQEENVGSDIDFLVDFPRGYDLFTQRLPLTEKLVELLQHPQGSFERVRTEIEHGAAMPYHLTMYTVIETPIYSAKVVEILATDERDAIAAFISEFPEAGKVVRG
jgi:predicted nucleotidyltransferase